MEIGKNICLQNKFKIKNAKAICLSIFLFKILLNDFVNFNVGSIKIPIIAITIINSINV